MNCIKITKKNNLGIIFMGVIVLLWPILPYLCDLLAVTNIFLYIFSKKIRKNNQVFLLSFTIILIALISFNIENVIYSLRWVLYLVNCYLIYSNLNQEKMYKILCILQILTLPVGLLYVEYLKSIDTYNLHLLGNMMFSGSKNHYSYYIIINYIILYYLGCKLSKNKYVILIITIIQLVMARSVTAILAFLIVYFILNVINYKNFKRIILLNGGIILSLLLLFNLGNKNEFINYNFNSRVQRIAERIYYMDNDESFNIRTEILFKNFNEELYSRGLKESFLGSGSYKKFKDDSPYDNSYYAIMIAGGVILVCILLMIFIYNIFNNTNKIYITILLVNIIFFMSANVFFELQNVISIVFLISPNLLFHKNNRLITYEV